jgi:hypothetical protein
VTPSAEAAASGASSLASDYAPDVAGCGAARRM